MKKVLTAWLFTLDATAPRAGCFALCLSVVETKWGDNSPFWVFFCKCGLLKAWAQSPGESPDSAKWMISAQK